MGTLGGTTISPLNILLTGIQPRPPLWIHASFMLFFIILIVKKKEKFCGNSAAEPNGKPQLQWLLWQREPSFKILVFFTSPNIFDETVQQQDSWCRMVLILEKKRTGNGEYDESDKDEEINKPNEAINEPKIPITIMINNNPLTIIYLFHFFLTFFSLLLLESLKLTFRCWCWLHFSAWYYHGIIHHIPNHLMINWQSIWEKKTLQTLLCILLFGRR